jgi:hypothetical protein
MAVFRYGEQEITEATSSNRIEKNLCAILQYCNVIM